MATVLVACAKRRCPVRAAVAALTSYAPARRAAAIDPAIPLRNE